MKKLTLKYFLLIIFFTLTSCNLSNKNNPCDGYDVGDSVPEQGGTVIKTPGENQGICVIGANQDLTLDIFVDNANAVCNSGTEIDGILGWRGPSQAEFEDLTPGGVVWGIGREGDRYPTTDSNIAACFDIDSNFITCGDSNHTQTLFGPSIPTRAWCWRDVSS